MRRGGADDTGLELVVADLTSDDGWPAASRVWRRSTTSLRRSSAQPADPDELIVPAREGTVRVLRAARDAGARRVMLTSSFAAVGYSPKAVRDYTGPTGQTRIRPDCRRTHALRRSPSVPRGTSSRPKEATPSWW